MHSRQLERKRTLNGCKASTARFRIRGDFHLVANPAIPVPLFQKGCRCQRESFSVCCHAPFLSWPLSVVSASFLQHRSAHPPFRRTISSRLRSLCICSVQKQQPLILQVGSRIFFTEAHIKGSQYAGAGSQPAGLQMLESTVAKQPKDRFIVLYCGCCPWNHCPNVGPAFERLRDLGFSRVKALYLPNNFGDDWVAKGYPTDRDQ